MSDVVHLSGPAGYPACGGDASRSYCTEDSGVVSCEACQKLDRNGDPRFGYRCLECGTASEDGAGHADGCGQPQRDNERGRREWHAQLEALITPSLGGVAGPAMTVDDADAAINRVYRGPRP